jgi:hypothetical protein
MGRSDQRAEKAREPQKQAGDLSNSTGNVKR